ncbi:MAG: ABC transporter permease subunit [Chloroflexi bacterium]|nr:ABC transporter permease subunit [Chloroflexota bacterium]
MSYGDALPQERAQTEAPTSAKGYARGLDWWKPVAVIVRRELRDQSRDWRILTPLIGLTLFFPMLMLFTANRMLAFVQRFGADLIAERLFPFLLLIVGFFPLSISLVIALESFAGERERGTIEPLLVAPITDGQFYLGKLLSVLLLPLVASYVGIAALLLSLYLRTGWRPDLALLMVVLALVTAKAVVMISGAMVVSTQATSVRSANLLASLIIIPIALLLQNEATLLLWRRMDVLWYYVFGLLVVAVLLTRTGLAHFNREGLLGRDLDALNLAWAWRTFKDAFWGHAPSLRAWYREQIGPNLRELRLPMLLMFGLLIVAVLLGARIAEDFLQAVPEDVLRANLPDREEMLANLQRYTSTFSLLGGRRFTMTGIFLHNVRALSLIALAGMLSYGVAGVLLLMVPFSLLGAGQALLLRAGWMSAAEYWLALVLPHGILEIPGVILFGASLLRLGAAWASPAQGQSLGAFWLRALARWAQIVVGVVLPLFLLASVVEAWITPRVALWLLSR